MKSIPAMLPVPLSIRWNIRMDADLVDAGRLRLNKANAAFCHAQAAASFDGLRRRVYFDGLHWRIEVAS